MANDRVHIKCSCGAWKMLMSYDGASLKSNESVITWLDKHGACRQPAFDLEGDPGFTLHTDDDVCGVLSIDKQNAEPNNNQ